MRSESDLKHRGMDSCDNNGNTVGSTVFGLDAYAGWSGRVTDLLPSLKTVDGYAVISSEAVSTLTGMERYRQAGDAAIVMASDDSARAQKGYVIHIPVSGGYSSRLKLVNTDSVQQGST